MRKSTVVGASLLGIAVHIALAAALYFRVRSACDGAMSYPLDDAYIHLALAKNLAHHGVFGVTRYAFTSTSSSVLWPFLLALFEPLFGDRAPFFLATLCGALVPPIVAHEADRRDLSAKWVYLAPIFAVLLAPTPTLAALGMEHALHVAATLAFLAALAAVGSKGRPARSAVFYLLASAFFVAGTRYEGGLLIAAGCIYLSSRRLLALAVATALVGLFPIVAFGLWAKSHGALFLPYSVVMKGAHPPPGILAAGRYFLYGAFEKLRAAPALTVAYIGAFCTLAMALFRRSANRRSGDQVALVAVVFVTATLHLLVAAVGWFFRYEAYLIVALLGTCAFSLAQLRGASASEGDGRLKGLRSQRVCLALALCGLFAFPSARSVHAFAQTPRAAKNIHEQQVQIARFLATEFPGEKVAVNDIGAVAYLHEGPIVDLMGLASGSVAKARGYRLASALTPATISDETGDVRVAVLYAQWFEGQLPTTWSARRTWTIGAPITPAFPTVTVYAIAPHEAEIDAAISRFETTLPKSIKPDSP